MQVADPSQRPKVAFALAIAAVVAFVGVSTAAGASPATPSSATAALVAPPSPVAHPAPVASGLTQTISVVVPEGRLYLEPSSFAVEPTQGSVLLTDVLAADLRPSTRGWDLAMTVTAVETTEAASPVVRVTPSAPRLLAGEVAAEAARATTIAVGETVVVASGTAFGSHFVDVALAVDAGRVEVRFELRSR